MKTKRTPSVHRGISFGTVFMTALTVVVLGLSGAILPRLLGEADFNMNVGGAVSALNLDDALTALKLSDIPITDATPTPEASIQPEQTIPAATPTPVPTPTPYPGGKITLTLGGSVCIDESVRKSAYYSDSKKYDFENIMVLIQEEMQSDLTLVTLENLTVDEEKVSALNAPSAVLDTLADAGVDILALGHQKALDKGKEGLRATIDEVKERGMAYLGAYATETDADTLRIFNVDNVKVAFLHYTESISNAGKKAVKADSVAYALPTTLVNGAAESMLAKIRGAREQGADIVIVSLNWGKSAAKPTAAHKNLAQQMADAGADVIVGSGSKAVQPVSWLTSKDEDGSIRHTLCAWNLASLLTGERNDGNVCSMLLQLQIAYDGDSVSFEKVCYTPTYIWRYKQDGQYYYRIVASDQPAPDGMSDDQIAYMEKALRNLQKYIGDSPVTLRTK
nr:CapA family protein [Clostridia bacterium]